MKNEFCAYHRVFRHQRSSLGDRGHNKCQPESKGGDGSLMLKAQHPLYESSSRCSGNAEVVGAGHKSSSGASSRTVGFSY